MDKKWYSTLHMYSNRWSIEYHLRRDISGNPEPISSKPLDRVDISVHQSKGGWGTLEAPNICREQTGRLQLDMKLPIRYRLKICSCPMPILNFDLGLRENGCFDLNLRANFCPEGNNIAQNTVFRARCQNSIFT